MAMKKSTPPPRPGGTGSPRKSSMELGTRKGTKVRKITKVTKPMTKSVVRNPDAPKSVGSGAVPGSVKPITKSETFMKKDKARRNRSGIGLPDNMKTFGKTKTVPSGPSAKYTPDRSKSADQTVRGTSARRGSTFAELRERDRLMKSAQSKGGKPSKVTPKKKAEPKPKPKPKRRIFVGRGGGMRGGAGGGLFDQIK